MSYLVLGCLPIKTKCLCQLAFFSNIWLLERLSQILRKNKINKIIISTGYCEKCDLKIANRSKQLHE